MEQYIPKSALVAEIERLRQKVMGVRTDFADGQKGALTDVLSLIDTLVVKGVDLYEQDIYSILYFERIVMREWGGHEYSNEGLCREILKRYKAQKEEEV